MKEKINISLVIASVLLIILVILQYLVIDGVKENIEYRNQQIDWWHNKCDSIIEKNNELYDKIFELQDSIITLKYLD